MGALIGNTMQFYDFTIYAFLAPQISQEFFNFKNPFLSYLIVFSVFAGGYFTRPLGSLLFGYLGDKNGRSNALSKTILLSTITTFLIGIIPGYQSIGFLSPVMLVVLRLMQGLSVSGEEGGAVVLLFEKYAFKNRGLIGSIVLSSVLAGVILGTFVCAITSQLIARQIIGSWGWRAPFLLSLPLGIIAMALRFYLNDFKLFGLAEKHNLLVQKPTSTLFKNHLRTIIFGVVIVSVYSVATSTLIVHFPYFLTIKAGFSHEDSLIIAIIAGVAIFSVITSLISSAIFSILVGSFPFGVRYSGVSLAFNLSVTLFSSSTPVVLILIEKYFDTPYAPGLYISLISLGCILITGYLRKKLRIEAFNEQEVESFIYKGN